MTNTKECAIDSAVPGSLVRNWPHTSGLIGLAGRASGQAFDLRTDLPCEPYSVFAPAKVVRSDGDVAARVAVRFDELQNSVGFIHRLLAALPGGPHVVPVEMPRDGAFGAGLIEGWRGPVFVALEAGPRVQSAAVTRMIHRGRTGRRLSTPSSAISSLIFP